MERSPNQAVEVELKEHERLDYFVREQLSIIQSSQYFAYSVDAILLANFVRVSKKSNVKLIDFCSGNGVLPLLLSTKTSGKIEGVEIQAPLVDMANRSIQLNQLQDRITMHHANLNDFQRTHKLYDVITCNPPYFSMKSNYEMHHLTSHAIARHEVHLTLSEWVTKARSFLRDKGKLYCVYRPERLDDLVEALLSVGFSMNRMQFAHGKADSPAKIVLIEAIANGGRQGVVIEPPIIIYNDQNVYTPQMRQIYYGEAIDN